MAKFSERLEAALRMRDMSPAELARKTGIGEGAISQYRKGAYKATQKNLEKIARAVDVSIPWLMGAEDNTAIQTPTPVAEDGHLVNIIKIAGRDGSFREKRLDDKGMQALIAFVDLLPDAPDDI